MSVDDPIETLYNHLYSQFEEEKTFDALDPLMTLLRKLDPVGLQMIGMLIDKHAKKQSKLDETPFGGKKESNTSAKFDIRQFDPVFQHMLFEFTKLHILKVNDVLNKETTQLPSLDTITE
jgi:hypothetical protein